MTPFPLYMHDAFGYPAAMALATLFGLAFGFVLERSGFGRASVLVAQFYGTDNRVLKVMFSGIVTASLGVGILSQLGVLDTAALEIPATFIGPQLIGGLLLGVGFAISGYCPGTALVAAGSGNRDGWYSILGSMIGAVAFAIAWPWLETFYTSGDMGRFTLPSLLGLPWPAVAMAVVGVAVGAFLLAEKAEGFFAPRAGRPVPPSPRATRNVIFGGMGAVGLAGLATLLLPARVEAEATRALDPIDGQALAEQLVTDPSAIWLVDLRDPARCGAARIPGALCLPAEDADAAMIADLAPTRRLVLYGEGELGALPATAEAWPGRVQVLSGGFTAFQEDLLTAPVPPEPATIEAVASYSRTAALHGQLTGSGAAATPVVVAKPTGGPRAVKKGGGC